MHSFIDTSFYHSSHVKVIGLALKLIKMKLPRELFTFILNQMCTDKYLIPTNNFDETKNGTKLYKTK